MRRVAAGAIMLPALFLPAALASASSTMISALPERFATATEDPDELGATGQVPEALRPSPDVIRGAVDPEALTGAGPPIEVPDGPLGIPEPMLFAYVDGARKLADTTPGCGVDWAVLASIGRIESAHARSGNIDVNGTTVSAILGPRLNGGPDIAAIRDTDNAFHDGDPVWDRAVGPMQFIPSTWSRYAVDGNDDLVASPHNVHDSITAAGNYLCAGRTDLRDPGNLAAAVFTYNQSNSYVREVLIWADAYRRGVNPVPTELAPPDDRDVLAGERLPEGSPDVLAEPEATPPAPDVEALPPLPELDEAVPPPPAPDVDALPEPVPPADQPPEPPFPDTGVVPPEPPDVDPPVEEAPQVPPPGKGDSVPPREQPQGDVSPDPVPPPGGESPAEPPGSEVPSESDPAEHLPPASEESGDGLEPEDPAQDQNPPQPQKPDEQSPVPDQPQKPEPQAPEPQAPELVPHPGYPGSAPTEEETTPQPVPSVPPEQAPEPTEPPSESPSETPPQHVPESPATTPPSEEMDVVDCDEAAISEGRFTLDETEVFDGPIPMNHTPPVEAAPGTWVVINAPGDPADPHSQDQLARCQVPAE
ncbi:lytic transglycosylase domain-containing protein [Allosaccharopolyspora coralli]|uniref:lytic transglycosylase domain-containing protein n=1 Tax=Allosaccharopolyspora coralli TaxID=2665642 RepID=UPI001E376A8A|nr:lytic murein transglycosylase [Allosaccharopolyspora coralli]